MSLLILVIVLAIQKKKEIEATYKAGYDELPDWLKYEICMLVNDFINSMDEEASKYKNL